jgi:hypothetical protein
MTMLALVFVGELDVLTLNDAPRGFENGSGFGHSHDFIWTCAGFEQTRLRILWMR